MLEPDKKTNRDRFIWNPKDIEKEPPEDRPINPKLSDLEVRHHGREVTPETYAAAFDESQHPRGQPGNAGEFASTGGASEPKKTEEPPPPKKEPKKFGKSKARTFTANGDDEKTVGILKKMFGKKAPAVEDLASIVGAPDDATVKIYHGKIDKKDVLEIKISHPDFDASRIIFKNASGIHVKNEEFWVKETAQGKGIGTEVFGRQVEQCQEMGIASIRCHAAKENPRDPSKPHNGYYTWPRFGYDASLDPDNFDDDVWDALDKNFPDAKTLLDMMATPEGREWWKKNGGDVFKMVFNLTPGSRSLNVFNDYMEEREQKKAS